MTNRNEGNSFWKFLQPLVGGRNYEEAPVASVRYRHRKTGARYTATTAEQITRYDADPDMERV